MLRTCAYEAHGGVIHEEPAASSCVTFFFFFFGETSCVELTVRGPRLAGQRRQRAARLVVVREVGLGRQFHKARTCGLSIGGKRGSPPNL